MAMAHILSNTAVAITVYIYNKYSKYYDISHFDCRCLRHNLTLSIGVANSLLDHLISVTSGGNDTSNCCNI